MLWAAKKLWLSIKVDNYEKIFGVVYRHPGYFVNDFQPALENTVEIINSLSSEYYICGDINIDLLQSETKINIKNYCDMLFSLGCLSLI